MLTLNGIQSSAPTESFLLSEEPLTGGPIPPPEQLPLQPKSKDQPTTKKIKALIKRSGPKRGGDK